MSQIRSLTVIEITALFGWPASKVYRLASTDRWSKCGDGRRPALYAVADVEATAKRIGDAS